MSTDDTNNWELNHKDNLYIIKNIETNKLRCDECNLGLKNEQGAIRHLYSKHNLNLDGSIYKPKPDDIQENPIESNSVLNNNNGFNSETPKESIDDVVMRINTTDDAKSAGKIVKDIELMYLFYMLKQKKIIHPEWSLHDFLRESAYFWAEAYGINASFSQNTRELNNNQLQVMDLVKQRWDEHEVE
jgi:hypothetical protein